MDGKEKRAKPGANTLLAGSAKKRPPKRLHKNEAPGNLFLAGIFYIGRRGGMRGGISHAAVLAADGCF